MGISVHTGWGACVVVEGSPAKPCIIANEVIELLADPERFCFHAAAEMARAEAARWIARVRSRALANATRALAPLLAHNVSSCAIVAKEGEAGDLESVLASHTRIHTAEGCFYRDILREAMRIPVRIIQPSALDPSQIGKLAPAPWGRDQKLAALAAWLLLSERRAHGA
jgi:hypothetical protein